jgi:hypothetical protein
MEAISIEDLNYSKSFLESVNKGISDFESGKTYSTEKLLEALATKRSKRIIP